MHTLVCLGWLVFPVATSFFLCALPTVSCHVFTSVQALHAKDVYFLANSERRRHLLHRTPRVDFSACCRPESMYNFRARAQNSVGWSEWSERSAPLFTVSECSAGSCALRQEQFAAHANHVRSTRFFHALTPARAHTRSACCRFRPVSLMFDKFVHGAGYSGATRDDASPSSQ